MCAIAQRRERRRDDTINNAVLVNDDASHLVRSMIAVAVGDKHSIPLFPFPALHEPTSILIASRLLHQTQPFALAQSPQVLTDLHAAAMSTHFSLFVTAASVPLQTPPNAQTRELSHQLPLHKIRFKNVDQI